MRIAPAAAGIAALAAAPAAAGTLTLDDAHRQGLALTVYNDGAALVQDRRRAELPAGSTTLALRGVSGKMKPATALLRSPGTRLSVVEQTFDFNVLTPKALLRQSVGDTVKVARTNDATGEETVEEATVLSVKDGVVLRFDDRIETNPPGRLIFPHLPAGLRTRPTLTARVTVPEAGGRPLVLSYLTKGLTWSADYVAEFGPGGDSLDLRAWATITNTTGTALRDADLTLAAGTVHRVRENGRGGHAERMMAAAAPKARDAKRQRVMGYHFYTFDRPVTLDTRTTKQLALRTARDVAARRERVSRGNRHAFTNRRRGENDSKAAIHLVFDNTEKAGLGRPLPGGVVRVYSGGEGPARFLGEDRLGHMAAGETVRLTLGRDFDVPVTRKQTDFKRIAHDPDVYETAHRITVGNATGEAMTVRLEEPVPGDWQLLEANRDPARRDAGTAVWRLDVPANGETTLTFRVRTTL